MDVMVFRSFCAEIARLSVGQIRSLRETLRTLEARIAVRARIDARGEALDRCPHCRGEQFQRWGETRTGLQRLRCKTCRRTFSSATGTALARLRLPEKFHQAVEDMLSRAPSSCRALAARLGVHRMTVWRWRMRVLAALTGEHAPGLGGVVEADEKLFRDSRKGSRQWVNRLRNPGVFSEPDRPRRVDYRRLPDRLPGGTWKYQVPVLTLTDRAGTRRAEVMPDRRGASVVAALERHIGRDAVLCSDGDGAYDFFARRHALPHYRLNAKTGPRVIDTAFHTQTVNALHSRFESFMKPFCAPATKNLPHYAAWFIAREQSGVTDATEQTWQRLLAA